jgi:hypothetical protein
VLKAGINVNGFSNPEIHGFMNLVCPHVYADFIVRDRFKANNAAEHIYVICQNQNGYHSMLYPERFFCVERRNNNFSQIKSAKKGEGNAALAMKLYL